MFDNAAAFNILLVVGIDSVGIARFPRILHDAGCRITLFAPRGLAVERSRYLARHEVCPAAHDALAGYLRAYLAERGHEYHHIIIGDESTLAAVAGYRGEPWLDGWFPVDHRGHAIDVMLSKSEFQQAATEAGLLMPQFLRCSSFAEVEGMARTMGYPVMLKSAHGCSGSGVRKVATDAELSTAYELLGAGNEALVVQQYLAGPIGSTDVLFDHGIPVCWQSSYSRLCWPTPLASSCAREVMDHRDVEPMLAGVGVLSGFHGFAGVDWIHDAQSDRLHLIELNPRPTPSYHLDTLSGVSFARSLHAMLGGSRLIGKPRSTQGPAPFIYLFPQSLYRAISERELSCLLGCWPDAPWRDPGLMAAYLRRVFTHFLPMHWRQAAKRLLRR